LLFSSSLARTHAGDRVRLQRSSLPAIHAQGIGSRRSGTRDAHETSINGIASTLRSFVLAAIRTH
jgi:hypothetical protein